ncbi:MAG: hypothetical protein GWN01_15685 [Nitrosopumilaceae archaeon]|nr:hypothetical protein [Nitrosopumilaceae archaeon]NIU88735.1 hypothetical protein [Nitrosopumilaceae archaeon]NIV66870.1 hypothetical protein [Nitrosopumilaceae archaeon]NIX62884.1 hypothetical protein [Nitrosopumilaceae archaeon]
MKVDPNKDKFNFTYIGKDCTVYSWFPETEEVHYWDVGERKVQVSKRFTKRGAEAALELGHWIVIGE